MHESPVDESELVNVHRNVIHDSQSVWAFHSRVQLNLHETAYSVDMVEPSVNMC